MIDMKKTMAEEKRHASILQTSRGPTTCSMSLEAAHEVRDSLPTIKESRVNTK